MGLTDFRYIITAQDRFSTTFRKFDQGVQSSARGLDKLSGVISGGGLGMLFGATAGVAGAIGIAKATWALGELGAQSITTRNSFETLMRSVGQSPALLDQMKAAAGGTITEMKLMQAANTALAGTSGALASELAGAIPQLIEAGRAAAMLNPSMGDAAFMTQSLITGIKRGSPMLIDNTGITLKLGEATDAYADSVGKSVEELTSQENSIAILRATLEGADRLLEQTAGSTNQMASSAGKLRTSWMELKTAIGEGLAPGTSAIQEGAASTLNQVTSVLTSTEFTRAMAMLQTYRDRLAALQAIPVDQRTTLDASDIIDAQRAIEKYERQIWALTAAEREMAATSLLVGSASGVMAAAVEEASGATVTFDDRLVRLIATARTGGAAMQALSAYINSVQAAASFTGRYTGFLGGVDVLSQTQYVALTRNRIDLERALNVQVAAGILQQQQADYQLQVFDNRVSDHISNLRNQTQAVGNVATSYDDLRDRISGAMRPTFDLSSLTGGLLGGQMGNGFDEAYKRLAAVALRPEELQIHAGDWASTFEQAGLTGLTPEDAQARARELVEAYSKGLDFSLIDREAIKDSVRQAIRADELYNSIADEIYREMGRPNPKAGAAGYALGRQIGAATTQALKDMAPDAIGAMAGAIAPSVARILGQQAARYEQ